MYLNKTSALNSAFETGESKDVNLFAHEFGHWMGLGDNKTNKEKLMYNEKNHYASFKIYPEPSEYIGLQTNYGMTNLPRLNEQLKDSKPQSDEKQKSK